MKYRIFWQIASLYMLIQVLSYVASFAYYLYLMLSGGFGEANIPALYIIGISLIIVVIIGIGLWALRNGFSAKIIYPDDKCENLDYTVFTSVMLCIMGCYLFIVNISALANEIFMSLKFWDDASHQKSIGDLFISHLDLWVLCTCAIALIFLSHPIAQFLVKRARGAVESTLPVE